MDKAERQEEINLLSKHFKTAQIMLCADYRGLTVAQVTNLRKELRQNKSSARVTKNTLASISASQVFKDGNEEEIKKLQELLVGPSMLVFCDSDPVAPAKVLAKFAKANDKLKIKGGFLDGKFVDVQGVDTLSNMPGREETLAKLLSLINTPAIQLLGVMKEPGAQLVRLLGAYRDKMEG